MVRAVDLYNFPKIVVLNHSLKSKSDISHFGAVDICNFPKCRRLVSANGFFDSADSFFGLWLLR